MNLRIIFILLAAVAAIGLAVVMMKVMRPKAVPQSAVAAAPAAPETPMTRVMVAKRDLPVGTRLAVADVEWQAFPSDNLNPQFVTDGPVKTGSLDQVAQAAGGLVGGGDLKGLVGATVREAILDGEPISQRKLVRAGSSGYLAVVLTPGMRAIAVPISAESAAGGFILPGDRVDVMQSKETENIGAAIGQVTSTQKTFSADTVLRNIKVLAIDQTLAAPTDSKSAIGAVATLEVSPGGAEALIRAKSQGSLVLTLRSYADTRGPSGAPAAPPPPTGGVVTVFKGGEATSFAVNQ